ncbi:unnamed protein product [Adineta steineri]|uniref:Heat shock factor binding protein 1 n=1 Tax=Adineta steineri TaxID=433720 RepID=A0A814G4F6_9BILA|nr:unnamed protein product [Adineta steineri]CAF3706252.1 unnamed protein product [Adineta steineri]
MTDSTTTTNLNIPFPEPRNAQELVNLVQTTITQIQDRFGQMSDSIMSRIDDCGQRIDTLERNVAHVISQRNAQ